MEVHPVVKAVLFTSLAALAVPSPALADDTSDGKDLFARGREMRARGDCAAAVPLFEKAYQVYPAGLGSLRNLAGCQESRGLFASARRSWLELKRALAESSDRRYSGWTDDADQAIAKLASKVAVLTVDLVVTDRTGAPASSSGVEVTLDGQSLGPSSLGAPLERDPGGYYVRAQGAGAIPLDEQRGTLVAGESKHIALRATVAAAPAPAPASPAAPAAVAASTPVAAQPPTSQAPSSAVRHDGPSAAWRAATWLSLGVGAGSLVAAAVSLGVRQAALADLEHQCPSYASSGCRSSIQPVLDRGQAASTAFDVLGAIGVAGTAVGVALYLTGRSSHATESLIVSPTGVLATGRF